MVSVVKMRQTAVEFFAPKDLSLEGVWSTPQHLPGPYPAFVVCHPHPLLGGDMDNPLVTAICGAAHDEGIATLRFNFRGVGESRGEFTNGRDEQQDVKSAIEFLKVLPGTDAEKIGLVGYSFGAGVVMAGARGYKSVRSFALIAPPLSSFDKSSLTTAKTPKLFVVGQKDGVVPSVDLQSALDEVRQPVQFIEVSDADHSLSGHQEDVAARVCSFMLETLR